MLQFTYLGLLAAVAQLSLGSPLVERQFDAQQVLEVLQEPSYSTASGDCAIYIGSKFSTRTTRTIVRTTILVPTPTTQFVTVSVIPEIQATVTITNYEEEYDATTITVNGTVSGVRITTITKEFSLTEYIRVTTTVPDPSNVVTVTETKAPSTTVITSVVTSTSLLSSTVYANPVPTPLAQFAPQAISSACSAFVNAPIPVPFAVVTTAFTERTTAYAGTTTATKTTTVSTVLVLEWAGTSTFTLTYTKYATTTGPITTRTEGKTQTTTSTLSLTRKVQSTSTVLTSAPVATYTVTSTSTIPVVATVSVPHICKSPIPGYPPPGGYFYNGSTKRIELKTTDTRDECCILCANTIGCAGYDYYLLGDCVVYIVESANESFEGTGKLSSQCPLGQLRGNEPYRPEGGFYGAGLCQN
ncbi:hypothetical protein BDZ91DRAFT_788726 [Kalaharituber pfeilii]|nr:hypothetical protein BDZ91DRAFT_788726 [Kalaharituber pfeilii]